MSKDTVAEEGEDNEENGKDHALVVDAPLRLDTVVHDHVPVLSRQDLHITHKKTRLSSYTRKRVNQTHKWRKGAFCKNKQ